MPIEKISTEVLVIGGGGAGMLAALEARKHGAEVLLLTKTVLGGGSCTALSFGAFRASRNAAEREDHFNQSLAAGRDLNDRELLRILVEQAPDRVRDIEALGVPLVREGPFLQVLGRAPFFGLVLTKALTAAVRAAGVGVLSKTLALDLLREGDRCAGLLAYDLENQRLIIVAARAVILASGGSGALYSWHDNSPRNTGDGYALAARAGVRLRDMEFVQFYPLCLVEGGRYRMIIHETLGDIAPIRNARGEDLLVKYDIRERPVALKARDALSQAIFREMTLGSGGGSGVYLDLTGLDDHIWDEFSTLRAYKDVLLTTYPGRERPLEVGPVCHYFMGGAVVGPTGRTSLPGLWAAGEVAGGLHGANRLGGNALSECAVFGPIAGADAATQLSRSPGPNVGRQAAEDWLVRLERWRAEPGPSGAPVQELTRQLARTMYDQAGIIRRRSGLLAAGEEVERLAARLESGGQGSDPADILRSVELFNLIAAARLVIAGALARPASLGAHCRED
ncbi:MAG: FAD-binding protein [Thermodesulfobacteriota bacterium]